MQPARRRHQRRLKRACWLQTAVRHGGGVGVLVGLLLLPLPVGALGPGDLGPSFGGHGTVLTDFECGSPDTLAALAIQPDGKIVVAGYSDASGDEDFALGRYHAITCNGVVATRLGTAGDDTLMGTDNPDEIVGFDGNDTIDGLGGNDILCDNGAMTPCTVEAVMTSSMVVTATTPWSVTQAMTS